MRTRFACIATVLALLSAAHAAEDEKQKGRYLATPFKGDYYVYGGSIGDSTPPTQKDRKLSIMLVGAIAKELFDHIGPDAKPSCSEASGYRERNRGDLSCTWTKEDGYSCYVGLNVQTGKSIKGSTC